MSRRKVAPTRALLHLGVARVCDPPAVRGKQTATSWSWYPSHRTPSGEKRGQCSYFILSNCLLNGRCGRRSPCTSRNWRSPPWGFPSSGCGSTRSWRLMFSGSFVSPTDPFHLLILSLWPEGHSCMAANPKANRQRYSYRSSRFCRKTGPAPPFQKSRNGSSRD